MNREVFDLLPDIVKGVGKNISRISNKMCRRICQRFCLSARLFGTPGWSQWWSFRDILKWQYCSGEKWKVGQILVWGRTVAKLLVVFLVPSIEPIIVMRVSSMAMMTRPRVSGVFIRRFSETVEVLRETRQLPSENDQCLLFLRQSLWKMMFQSHIFKLFFWIQKDFKIERILHKVHGKR